MHQQRVQKLFDELSAALVLYARQWCDLPDDAVQEAFIDLAKCCNEPESPKAWLYTTTRRKSQNIARSESRRRHHQQRAGKQRTNSDDSVDWFAKSSPAVLPPEDVIGGLGVLDSDERELVVARIWGDLNFEQLAELLDCSVSSAHRRYIAVLAKLKSLLAEGDEQSVTFTAPLPPKSTRHSPAAVPGSRTAGDRKRPIDRTTQIAPKLGSSSKRIDGDAT